MTFHSNLDHIANGLAAVLDTEARQAAEKIEQRAKARVVTSTGRLRDSIHVERNGVSDYQVLAGDSHVFYGALVEFGDANTPPRPFLVPALEESRDETLHAMAAAIRSLL